MTHTRGPWRVTTQPEDGRLIADLVDGRPGLRRYSIVHDGEEEGDAMADACLLAAAPEMLEALRSAVEWSMEDGPDESVTPEYAAHRARLRAMIAKAEGRS